MEKQNIIAIVYDFDKTLSPDNMQEETIFKVYGIDKDKFWAKAQDLVKNDGYERTLAYLKLLMVDHPFRKDPLKKSDLNRLASKIRYYPGVGKEYFEHIEGFLQEIPEVKEWGIQLEHYVISSGLTEIIEGSKIRKYFKRIYGCEYEYQDDKPVFPKLVINDTNKTQFLFRINKGKLDLSEDINHHMEDVDKRIPFQNMIYIGDSETDVPSMTLTQKMGGYAIAVYHPEKEIPEEVKKMVAEERAAHFAPADYCSDSLLTKILHRTLKKIVHTMSYRFSSDMSFNWVKNHSR